MSWDVFLINAPQEVESPSDLTEEILSNPIGSKQEVIARLQELLPQLHFGDRSKGVLEDTAYTMEIAIGDEAICTSILIFVRGGGDAIATVVRIIEHLQVRAIDCQSGEFFNLEEAKESFTQWQGYRDRLHETFGDEAPGSNRSAN